MFGSFRAYFLISVYQSFGGEVVFVAWNVDELCWTYCVSVMTWSECSGLGRNVVCGKMDQNDSIIFGSALDARVWVTHQSTSIS